ncbi:MAG: hypothetical protein ACRDC4_16715, partial [Plesiomonas sp.]
FEANHQALSEITAAPQNPVPNLPMAEVSALKSLIDRRDIIIKPVDKGSAVVIMDREEYIEEGLRQLQNQEFYIKISEPIFEQTIPKITEIIQSLLRQGHLQEKQAEYLNTNPRVRRFYLLPKIHKPQKAWPSPFMPPGRPIVSDSDSESYRIAEYIDSFLKPLATRHESFVRDSYDFIEKIKPLEPPTQAFLFTMDGDSLYTNIETPLGIQAINDCFQNNPDPSRPDAAILKLLQLSLENNDFEFAGRYFLQIKGTAMWKKFAPSYANIYMAQWEETVFVKCPLKSFSYFRYLDDIWGIWDHGKGEFDKFVQILNNHHQSIKLKTNIDPVSSNFLDITIYKGPDFETTRRLDTKVFFKETDMHALLQYKSFHPRHTFQGIVSSQLLRFSRICSKERDFLEAQTILFRALRSRGYPRSKLRLICKSHTLKTRKKTLAPSSSPTDGSNTKPSDFHILTRGHQIN